MHDSTIRLVEQLGFRISKILGSGYYGVAVLLTDGRVMKLTASAAEEFCVLQMLHRPFSKHLPMIEQYDFLLSKTGSMFTFWYVREALHDVIVTRSDVMEAAYQVYQTTGLILQDFGAPLSYSNWGQRTDGTLVFRDLACRTWDGGYHPTAQGEVADPIQYGADWMLFGGMRSTWFEPYAASLHLTALRRLSVETGWPLMRYIPHRLSEFPVGVLRPDGWLLTAIDQAEFVRNPQRLTPASIAEVDQQIKRLKAPWSSVSGEELAFAEDYQRFHPRLTRLDPHAPQPPPPKPEKITAEDLKLLRDLMS